MIQHILAFQHIYICFNIYKCQENQGAVSSVLCVMKPDSKRLGR